MGALPPCWHLGPSPGSEPRCLRGGAAVRARTLRRWAGEMTRPWGQGSEGGGRRREGDSEQSLEGS